MRRARHADRSLAALARRGCGDSDEDPTAATDDLGRGADRRPPTTATHESERRRCRPTTAPATPRPPTTRAPTGRASVEDVVTARAHRLGDAGRRSATSSSPPDYVKTAYGDRAGLHRGAGARARSPTRWRSSRRRASPATTATAVAVPSRRALRRRRRRGLAGRRRPTSSDAWLVDSLLADVPAGP